MKILITGGSGLLGSKIIPLATRDYQTFAVHKTHKISGERSFQLDITNKAKTCDLIKKLSPDIIIHTAAMTDVDLCETAKEKAWHVNVDGTKNIVEASKKLHSKLVYISTDYVFDGKKGMYKEEDPPNPINYYGETKLEGERVVQRLCNDYMIVRASVIYGWGPAKLNFVTWVIKKLKGGTKINIVKDQFNSPTLADNLAEIIWELVKRRKTGIFHASGRERINRLEFAKKIARIFGLNEDLISPTTSDELAQVAKRPFDSSLDVSKVSELMEPLNVKEGLERMRSQA